MPGTPPAPLSPVAGHFTATATLEAAERQHRNNLTTLARAEDRLVRAGALLSPARERSRLGGPMSGSFMRRYFIVDDFDDPEEFIAATIERISRLTRNGGNE